MRKVFLLVLTAMISLAGFSQHYNIDSSLSSLKTKKDSTLHAMKVQRDSIYRTTMHTDSVKADKDFTEKEKWENIKASAIYPVLRAGDNSGVIPVKDPTEIPDPKMEYKLLFEITANNPDSVAKEINYGLTEVARVINLHVASGIPLKNISPVIVVHAAALNALTTNEYYKEHFKVDNPNIKVINDLKNIGAKFIACGQAMAFFDIKREVLLPDIKISLTAQTALSYYRLKGYVQYW